MSEEKKENSSEQPTTNGSAETPAAPPKAPAEKPAASPAPAAAATPAAKAAEPPPPPPPGEYGQALEKAGINVNHLGKDANGYEMINLAPADLLKGATFIRDQGFDLLLSCSGVDWKDRLESVYHLFSTQKHQFLVIKVTAENGHSPSLYPVWSAADWHERESYDLLGIHYDGHPNLTRILMPVDWLGHPLRKDYKVDDPRLVWNER
jgi:NADH-quinone oxidoreductase subunit C